MLNPEAAAQTTHMQAIKRLLQREDAVLVAHYYVDAAIQALAEETGGFVGDSLAMAKFGQQAAASTLVVAGVRFMGETAKILSPKKRVLMPTLEATCSLDEGCDAQAFSRFCDAHPERTVVVYANTSAAVKARADWVVTSSIALSVVEHLDAEGHTLIWAPDRHLGHYIEKKTGADMLHWNSVCVVHDEYHLNAIEQLQQQYSNAALLVHPESPAAVIERADVVGSTAVLLQAVSKLPHDNFIVATERGIFYKMQQAQPEKRLIPALSHNLKTRCQSCGHCPWMKMNALSNLHHCLAEGAPMVTVPPNTAERAARALQRMVDFSKETVVRA